MDDHIVKGKHSAGEPRILFVIPEGEGEAAEIFSKRQVLSLQRGGITGKNFFLASRRSPFILMKEYLRFRKEIWEFKPDIVHAHYGTMTSFFSTIAANLPLVVTFRGSDLNRSASISWLRWSIGMIFSQLSALKAVHTICVSGELKGKLWWRKKRVSIMPSGVDTTVFYPRPRDEVRAELGWGKDEKVVLFNAGREAVLKGLDLAQAAVDVARNICGEIRFVILNGHVAPGLVPAMMNAADCLTVTSKSEGSPTIVQEAIATNLPIVSVDVGDVKEVLANVSPSQVVQRDPEEIGRAIAAILMDPCRSNGYDVVKKFSLDNLALRVLDIYHKVRYSP